LPETSTAVQRPSLKQALLYKSQAWKYARTSNPIKRDSKTIPTRQNAPCDQRILKPVTKNVTQRRNSLDKAVNDARQPKAVKPHLNIRISQW